MTTFLLEVNVLIDAEPGQHHDAYDWFGRTGHRSLATMERRLVTDAVRTGAAALHLI